jgi:copper chaperone CopZ
MKILMLITVFALIQMMGTAQTKSSAITETVEFQVYGNCGMCKSRIEKALKIEGIESAKWDAKKNMITVAFQPGKIEEEKLHQLIADVGHDTEKVIAKDEAYNKLHGCCRYERNKKPVGEEINDNHQNTNGNHKH